MFINKIKQNFAGFAVVALAFAGLSAVAPASATAYASNAGSVADPYAAATFTTAVATNASTMVTSVTVPAGQKLTSFITNTQLSSAESTALRGKVITYSYSVLNTGTNTAITGAGLNPGIRVNGGYTQFPYPPAAPQVTWPSTTGTTDTLSFTAIHDGTNSLPAGTYDFTFKWFADGVQITTAPLSAQVASRFASGISGTTPALSNMQSIQSGYVCVNPSLIAAGDTLTARPIVNGSAVTWQSGSVWWYAGGSNIGSNAAVTVSAQNIAAGVLAVKGTFGSTSGITAGTPYTADVSITNGAGTEVTYPCPSPTATTPVVTSSSASSIVATVATGTSMCMARRVVGQFEMPGGFGNISGTTCTITPMGPSFSDGTYTIVAYVDAYWTGSSASTNNPQVTFVSGAPSQQQQAPAQNNNVQQNTPPTPPTNVPLVAPIAMPAAGFTPGGALTLSGSNLSNLTSVKIGETVAKTVASASGVTISVPADLTPGAHNLLITTSTGSTLFVGAIKVADPVVEAAKAAKAKAAASIAYRAPVDFTVNKSAVAQAAAAKAFAAQYRSAKTAICVAIPASKATSAAALAAATKVCDGFKASVPGIKLSVVLGAPSGDKINRVSAELQG